MKLKKRKEGQTFVAINEAEAIVKSISCNLMHVEEKKWCARSDKREKATSDQYNHQTSKY